MASEPEVIRQEMQENRNALTEKLETLEKKVVGLATAVPETVENVVESVKGGVEQTMESVKESVQTLKDSLNLRKQTEAHPLAMLGGAVGVGFVVGLLLRGATSPRRTASYAAQPAAGSFGQTIHKAEEAVEHGFSKIKDVALTTVAGLVTNYISETFPDKFGESLKSVVHDVLGTAGAESQQQSASGPSQTETSTSNGGNGYERYNAEMGRPVGAGSR
jgi:ElaB/YqjD/DUF883 family membrane-anchored ribosome-binding protein